MADEPQLTTAAGAATRREEWQIPAEAASVPGVRRRLREFGRTHGADDEVIANVALAVTEAVTNAVMHAYVDLDPGVVSVTAQAGQGELVVCVSDDGRGMQPRPDSPGLGMGLPMIGQLTTSVDIRERPAGGTEVRMRFQAPGVCGPADTPDGEARLQLLVDVARLAQSGGWPQQGVGRLVHLLVPAIADACSLDRMQGTDFERLAGAGVPPPVAGELPPGHEARVIAGDPSGTIGWWVDIPLRDADRGLGLLRLGIAPERGEPTADDLVFFESLGERAARGLAGVQLVADLRRTRRRVERILDCLAEAVTVDDGEGLVVYANAAAVELLGAASVQEVLAAAPGELASRYVISREDGSPVRLEDLPGRRVVAGRPAPPLLTRCVRRDTGEERWLLTKATLLDDGDRLAVNVIEDVTEAKRAELRTRFLADAGKVLGASLDPERTLQDVAALVVPRLADWCAVDVVDEDGQPRRVAVAHADPARLRLAEELEHRYPAHQPVQETTRAILEGGPALLLPEIPDELLVRAARDDGQLEIWRTLGMRSCLILPMRVAGRTTGILTMVTAESARAFDADDLAFGEDIASRAAIAIENARLYSEGRPA